jgi:hypothetical protein
MNNPLRTLDITQFYLCPSPEALQMVTFISPLLTGKKHIKSNKNKRCRDRNISYRLSNREVSTRRKEDTARKEQPQLPLTLVS